MNYKSMKNGFKLLTIALIVSSIVGCSTKQSKPVIYNNQLNEKGLNQEQKDKVIDSYIKIGRNYDTQEIKTINKYSGKFKLEECKKYSEIDLKEVIKILNDSSKKELKLIENTDEKLTYENNEFKLKQTKCKPDWPKTLYSYNMDIESKTKTDSTIMTNIGDTLVTIAISPVLIILYGIKTIVNMNYDG